MSSASRRMTELGDATIMPNNYQDLLVWRKSMDFVEEIYRLTRSLPREEIYGLTTQLRRAAVSIPSNIAEGHGRSSDRDFAAFLSYAKGSACESATQLLLCVRLGYLQQAQVEKALGLCTEIQNILTSFILKLTT